MPKVSVIVPVYKVEKYLEKCLQSLSVQTLKDIEVIIVDDGSPDNSIDIAKLFIDKDNRFRLISQENKGLGGARNTGLSQARSDYIAFVDSDDWVAPEFCEVMYQSACSHNTDLVLMGETLYLEDKEKFCSGWRDFSSKTGKEKINQKNFLSYFTPAWARLYKKSFLLENHLKFVEHCYYEDNSWGCFFILLNPTISFCDTKYFYRQRQGSITAIKDSKVIDWVKDYKFFESYVKSIKPTPERLLLCQFWYLLNFFNYFNQLDKVLQERFFYKIKSVIQDWEISITDLQSITRNADLSNKLYFFYVNVKDKEYRTNSVRSEITDVYKLFGKLTVLSVYKFQNKQKYNLFGVVPILKIKRTERKKVYYVMGLIPVLKVK